MANEFTLTGRVTYANGSAKATMDFGTRYVSQTTQGMAAGIQSVGTTAEAIGVTDISTKGLMVCRNLDATNYVEIGMDSTGTFVPTIKLKAGEDATFRVASGTLQAKANTAAVKLQYWLFED